MRLFGLIGLVIALLVVGLLVKKQMGVITPPALPSSAAAAGSSGAVDPRTQGRQIEQQFKQSIDDASQPRPMPDDAR